MTASLAFSAFQTGLGTQNATFTLSPERVPIQDRPGRSEGTSGPKGIFLVGHAIVVFVGGRFFGAEWEQRKVDEYLR